MKTEPKEIILSLLDKQYASQGTVQGAVFGAESASESYSDQQGAAL